MGCVLVRRQPRLGVSPPLLPLGRAHRAAYSPTYRFHYPDNAEGIAAAFGAEVGINADPPFDLNAEAVPELDADAGFDFVADPILAVLQEANDDWDELPDFNECPSWAKSNLEDPRDHGLPSMLCARLVDFVNGMGPGARVGRTTGSW